ncbi:MAG: diguanylate cyclase [Candidatus Hydrogenedentes bacterium]|nr:diguanylate cyclase [Candidatus Hydrogenedentota bacterium]
MRILIAEDDATSRVVLSGVLAKQGHEVVTAVNGVEALRALQGPDAPQLAILDWVMPELTGVEVCSRVRAQPTERPPYIIMLTSKDAKADVVAGLDAGADDYLAKPYDAGELRARVSVGTRLIELRESLLEARNALAHEATHDPLTGALNRRAVTETIARELSRSNRHLQKENWGLSVGICDVDHFKKINDTMGHGVGDEVLCELSRRLTKSVRAHDTVGRFGGEEFVVVASGIGEDYQFDFYERLRREVADVPFATNAGLVRVTLSIGASAANENQTMDEVLSAADTALYRAKAQGRNCVCIMKQGTEGIYQPCAS